MLESIKPKVACVAHAYRDLAHELCQLGILLAASEEGPTGPYHIIQVGHKFVVLKRYNSLQQSELTGSICVAIDEAGAARLALDYGGSSASLDRWLVIPLPTEGKCEWYTTAIASSPVTSSDIAAEINRQLMLR